MYKTKHALNGLKQSSRAWEKARGKVDKRNGYEISKREPAVARKITKQKGKKYVTLRATHVDDTITTGEDMEERMRHIKAMKDEFSTRQEGPATNLLGVRVTYDYESGDIMLDQKEYLLNNREQFDERFEYRRTETPWPAMKKLLLKCDVPQNQEEKREAHKLPYQKLIGTMMWASEQTKQEVSFYIRMLSTKLTMLWTVEHFEIALRLYDFMITSLEWAPGIRYSTKNIGPHRVNELVGYSDASWTGTDGRHTYTHLEDEYIMPEKGSIDAEEIQLRLQYSTYGYFTMMNGGVISKKCKGYPFIIETVAEAEMIALNEASKEIIHQRAMVEFMTYKEIKAPTKIWVDNQATYQHARSGKITHQNKHIARKHLAFVERCEEGIIQVFWVQSNDNPADLYTKIMFDAEKFKRFSKIILGWEPFKGDFSHPKNK